MVTVCLLQQHDIQNGGDGSPSVVVTGGEWTYVSGPGDVTVGATIYAAGSTLTGEGDNPCVNFDISGIYNMQYSVAIPGCPDDATFTITINECVNNAFCDRLYVHDTNNLIELELSAGAVINETLLCSALTSREDLAIDPAGNFYVSENSGGTAGGVYTLDTGTCATTQITTVNNFGMGNGLSYFRNGLLIHGSFGTTATNPLVISTSSTGGGSFTTWANTGLIGHNITGDLITVGNFLYVIMTDVFNPPNVDIWRFGINNDGTWDGTQTNMGTLPGGGNNDWFGGAYVDGTLYGVDGSDVYAIDPNNPAAATLIYTTTLNVNDLRGAASVEDGNTEAC